MTCTTMLTRLHPMPPGGATLEEAFENVALAMFNYMTVQFPSKEAPLFLPYLHEG